MIIGFLILQFVAAFFYETTIFMPIALSFLLYVNGREKDKIKLISFIISPFFIYFVSKVAIQPLIQHKDKLIGLSNVYSNWYSSLHNLALLMTPKYLYNFWGKELLGGFDLINGNILAFLLLSVFLILISNSRQLIISKFDKPFFSSLEDKVFL